MELVADDLPGDSYTMHSAAGTNLVDIPDSRMDSIMIKLDPVFQMRAMRVIGVVNRLENIASQKSGQFSGIDLVVLIPFGSY